MQFTTDSNANEVKDVMQHIRTSDTSFPQQSSLEAEVHGLHHQAEKAAINNIIYNWWLAGNRESIPGAVPRL